MNTYLCSNMDILLSTDQGYFVQTCVLMTSIGMHNTGVVFHVLLEGEPPQRALDYMADKVHKYGNEIAFYTVPSELLDRVPDDTDKMTKLSKACYSILFTADLLPTSVHKVLYLDGDIIVRGSLMSLYDVDLAEYSIAAVEDRVSGLHAKDNWLPYDMSEGYFNSGVLLMNLDYFREHNCTQMFWDFLERYHDIQQSQDQDVLNATLHESVKKLPLTYNFQKNFLLDPEHPLHKPELNEEIEATKDDPLIIHYCGVGDRPWQRGAVCPYLKVWRYYFLQTGMDVEKLPWVPIKTKMDDIIAHLREEGVFLGRSPFRTDVKDLDK